MTSIGVLVAVGAMLVLAGLAGLISMAVGVEWSSQRGHKPRRARRRLRPGDVVAVVLGLLTLLLTGWIAAGFGAAGAVLVVPQIVGRDSGKGQLTRLDALGSWIRRLSDLLASGAASSLERALEKSAAVAPDPIASEVTTLAGRIGPQGTRAALLGFARDMADPVSDEVVMSLILQLRHGGRGLAAVLSDLADHVDDLLRMRREVEADRAKPRANVRTIVLLTLGLSVGLILFARDYLQPYHTVIGQIALLGVVGLFAAALLWLRQMVRRAPGQRLLIDADLDPASAA